MRLAFVLLHYYWYRGGSRDFLRIAKECQRRNHEVIIYTAGWEGNIPAGIPVNRLAEQGGGGSANATISQLAEHIKLRVQSQKIDGVVGECKMPGLDVYYASGTCDAAYHQERYGRWRNWLPHNRRKLAFERSVFSPESSTTVLCITEHQAREYQRHYGTQDRRFKILPPLLDPTRWPPLGLNRMEIRCKLGIQPDTRIMLFAASGFRAKGLDRAIIALASLDDDLRKNTSLYVVGEDKHQAKFERMAKRLKVSGNIRMLGNPDNLPALMAASDVLLHPAYSEAGANVMLESIVSGLPVLATDVCGFAYHIRDSGAGKVISSPFDQENMNSMLEHMLVSSELKRWSKNGIEYGKDQGLYKFPATAADFIEVAIERKRWE